MLNGNGFASSGKHGAVFLHMGVQSFPMTQVFATLSSQLPRDGS